MFKLITLFGVFFKIGLVCFGGGYAMIPLIQEEMLKNQWLSIEEFHDIIAITSVTPGSIAINSATFVGQYTAGIIGGVVATLGVVLPSIILILIISRVFFQFNQHPIKKTIFYYIRPTVIGLILSAALSVGETSFFQKGTSMDFSSISVFFNSLDFKSIILFLVALFVLMKNKINPILVLILSAIVGIVIF